MANVTNHVSINGSVGTTEGSQFVGVDVIYLIKNTHASQTLTVNFGADTSAPNTIVLAAGESLSNLKIPVGTLYYKGSGATTTFKFIGGKGFSV